MTDWEARMTLQHVATGCWGLGFPLPTLPPGVNMEDLKQAVWEQKVVGEIHDDGDMWVNMESFNAWLEQQ